MIALIRETFPDVPVMVSVAKGESRWRQWDTDGNVIVGSITPEDKGLFQINTGYWSDEARRLGLDFENSIIDNVKMARYIYDTQGITAWVYYNKHLSKR